MGNTEIGRNHDPPGPIDLGTQRAAEWRGGNAGSPEHRARDKRLVANGDALGVDPRDRPTQRDANSQVFQLAQRGCGQLLRKGGQDSRPGFDQPYPCGRWIDTAEFPLQGVARNLRKCAGEFNTGRPSADDHEIQPGLALTVAPTLPPHFQRH